VHPCTTLVHGCIIDVNADLEYVSEVSEFFEQYRQLHRRISSVAEKAYAAIDVGKLQASFLRYIGENNRISQAELARITDTAPTLTGRTVDTLIEHGWVRRQRNADDRREYMLDLTASGKRMRDRCVQTRDAMIKRINRLLGDRDVEDFDRIVTKILAGLDGGSD
jgi:DNA-binding MarR family transcriptional regulator